MVLFKSDNEAHGQSSKMNVESKETNVFPIKLQCTNFLTSLRTTEAQGQFIQVFGFSEHNKINVLFIKSSI